MSEHKSKYGPIGDGPLVLNPVQKKMREFENYLGQFVPQFLKDYVTEQEKKGFTEALLPNALAMAPGLGGVVPRVIASGTAQAVVPQVIPGSKITPSQRPGYFDPNTGLLDMGVGGKRIVAEKDGVLGFMIPGKPDSWVADGDKIGISDTARNAAKERYLRAQGRYSTGGVEYDGATGQAIDPNTGKISSGGYSIDPKTGKRTNYESGETRLGTDTTTGNRESEDPMAIWARKHGKLADRVIDKVENRGLQQAGYEAIRDVRLGKVETGDSDESPQDMAVMGMPTADIEAYFSPDGLETVIEPDGTVTSGNKIVKTPDQAVIPAQPLPAAFPEAHKEAQAFFQKSLRQQMGK